jgi:hypothetical protein
MTDESLTAEERSCLDSLGRGATGSDDWPSSIIDTLTHKGLLKREPKPGLPGFAQQFCYRLTAAGRQALKHKAL